MAYRIVRANLLDKNTHDPIEDVDVLTCADAVLFDDGKTLREKLEEELKYSNSDPMPIQVGGYPEGTSFNNKGFKDMFYGLLYPYTKPLISLSANPASSIREKGTSITPIQFTAKITKKSEAIKSVKLYKDNAEIDSFTGEGTTGTGNATYTYTPAVNTNCSFTAKVKDARDSEVTSNSISYTFVYPMFVGTLDASKDSPVSSDILALTKKVVNRSNQSNTFTMTNKRMCIACPPGWTISEILDPNLFNITASFTLKTVSVKCADNTNQNYNVYISEPTTQTGFKVTFNL